MEFELLAPGGDLDSIKAAVAAGADALYCGLMSFNARNRAANITFDDLHGVLTFAHSNACKVFLTLNVMILESEVPALIDVLNRLSRTTIDGVIIQDTGLFYLVQKYFPTLKVHASTQCTTHNRGQLEFLKRLGVERVNLSRELTMAEVAMLTQAAHEGGMQSEVFVHGSYCISFSGACYLSSVLGGSSGNRGRCSQPCRDRYETTPAGKSFPLNLKDNSAFAHMKALHEAGVDSLKIEGRMKKAHYVYAIVDAWRRSLESLYEDETLPRDDEALYRVFNRELTGGYLADSLSEEMYLDNSLDNSLQHFLKDLESLSEAEVSQARQQIVDDKERVVEQVEGITRAMVIGDIPLTLRVSGALHMPLTIVVEAPRSRFEVTSTSPLAEARIHGLTAQSLAKRLHALGQDGYFIEELVTKQLDEGLFLPYKELTALKTRIMVGLHGMKHLTPPVVLTHLMSASRRARAHPGLEVVFDTPADAALCINQGFDTWYKLPEGLDPVLGTVLALFGDHPHLLPWFPSILIGRHFTAAVEFLKRTQPRRIITNNTGVAHAAGRLGIPWIAGPHLNVANSYSLLALKERFGAQGAFLSGELSGLQLEKITAPENFEIHYSIYHPLLLMTSRLCLFHQVTGCDKGDMDESCLTSCERSTSIRSARGDTFRLHKALNSHHHLYHSQRSLNTPVISDLSHLLDVALIDLSRSAGEMADVELPALISLFSDLVQGIAGAEARLHAVLPGTTNQQYHRGL